MNYEEMSDFEINRAVACVLDGTNLDIFGRPMFAIDCYFSTPSKDCVNWFKVGYDEAIQFDPCNNPSDAYPIIFENNISVTKHGGLIGSEFDNWDVFGGGIYVDYDHNVGSYVDCKFSDKNPLRAAMIVFLMMNEEQK